MARYTKAALDALTDQTIMMFRHGLAPTLDRSQADYAVKAADVLALQFPGVPGLARVVLACAQLMCPLGAEDYDATYAVAVLAAAGLALEEAGDG